MNLIFCKFKKSQKAWNSFFCQPKKLKTHESNFYEAVKLSKSLKTASKDPVSVSGKCRSFGKKVEDTNSQTLYFDIDNKYLISFYKIYFKNDMF